MRLADSLKTIGDTHGFEGNPSHVQNYKCVSSFTTGWLSCQCLGYTDLHRFLSQRFCTSLEQTLEVWEPDFYLICLFVVYPCIILLHAQYRDISCVSSPLRVFVKADYVTVQHWGELPWKVQRENHQSTRACSFHFSPFLLLLDRARQFISKIWLVALKNSL